MHAILEPIHRHLPEHRRDLAFEALGEQREARLRVGRPVEEAPEGHGLTEHRRGLRERQWRALVEDALLAREVRVEPVTHLVREREHVASA